MKRAVQFFFITFVVVFSLSCEDPIEFVKGLIDELTANSSVESEDGGNGGGTRPETGGTSSYTVYVKAEVIDPSYDYRGHSVWLPKTSKGPHSDNGKKVLSIAKVYESTYDSDGPDVTYSSKKVWRLYFSPRKGLTGIPEGKIRVTLKVINNATGKSRVVSSERPRQGVVVYLEDIE